MAKDVFVVGDRIRSRQLIPVGYGIGGDRDVVSVESGTSEGDNAVTRDIPGHLGRIDIGHAPIGYDWSLENVMLEVVRSDRRGGLRAVENPGCGQDIGKAVTALIVSGKGDMIDAGAGELKMRSRHRAAEHEPLTF